MEVCSSIKLLRPDLSPVLWDPIRVRIAVGNKLGSYLSPVPMKPAAINRYT